MSYFAPAHSLRIFAVLEDFSSDRSSPADRAVDWSVTPHRARLERNDIHTADKLTLEVDFRQYPFDPRLIRAASVAYYAWDAAGDVGVSRETLRFLGTVDVPEMNLGEESHTSLECRDYTAFLLAKKSSAAMQVALDRPLDDILRELLATLPGEQATLFTLVLYGGGSDWPVVHGGGRRGAKLPVEPKDTLWSVILRLVQMAGLVCWVDLDQLVVSTPRNVTGTTRPTRFSFGRNLSDLRIKKNTQNLTRTVALTQYDPRTGIKTTGIYPPPPRPTAAHSGGGRGHGTGGGRRTGTRSTVVLSHTGRASAAENPNEAEEFNVTGNRTQEQLTQAAEHTYRSRARTEVEGSFTTHDMRVGTTDLLALKTSDAILAEIEEQARVIVTSAGDASLSVLALVDLGYPATVAQTLVASWRSLDRIRLPFVVRKATLQIDDGGFQGDVDFQNAVTPFVEEELAPDAVTQGGEVTFGAETTVTARRPR